MTTVPPHPFVPDGIPNHRGVDGCAVCPLPKSRTDIHITPEPPAEAREIDARVLGEGQQQ